MRSTPVPPRAARLRAVPPAGLCWAAIAPLLAPSAAAHAARDQGRVAYVVDADTVRLDSGIGIRIAGIDSAETRADRTKRARDMEVGKAHARRVSTMLEGRRTA